MRRYYIVKHYDPSDHQPFWYAYKDGLFTRLGYFNWYFAVYQTCSFHSADECERKLMNILHPKKPEIVRIVENV